MRIESRATGPFAINVYLIACNTTKEAAIIDCGGAMDWARALVEENDLEVRYLLQTHAHIDHVAELGRAKDLWPNARICLHPADEQHYQAAPLQGRFFGLNVSALPPIDQTLQDDEELAVGELRLHVMHTPGHTPGHVVFTEKQHKVSFSGDLLFAGSIGRTDLPGGDYKTILASLRTYFQLDDDIRVFSGHGPETSLGRERRTNPFVDEL